MKKLITTAVLLTAVSAQAEVTYEQILMDPDNVSLNQTYVRERLAAGDLSQALVSVERIILLQPLNMDARVARAQILMRLGNMTSAKQELDALDALPLGDRLSSQVDELLAEVEAQQQRWSVLGSVSFGFSSDDNVGNHTDTGRTANASGQITVRSLIQKVLTVNALTNKPLLAPALPPATIWAIRPATAFTTVSASVARSAMTASLKTTKLLA